MSHVRARGRRVCARFETGGKVQTLLVATAVMLGLMVWASMRGHPQDASFVPTVVAWLASLAAAIGGAMAMHSLSRGSDEAPVKAAGMSWTTVILGVILVLAFLVRVFDLDHIPYVFGGDEGSQAMSAVAVLSGLRIRSAPVGTRCQTGSFLLQAGALWIVGDSVSGARMIAVLLGVAAVWVTFLLTRRLFGTVTAVIAAMLLATFHYHIHFSRLSSNQIADSLAIVAVLYALERTIDERRPLDALLAGIAIGLSQYFSFAGRIIPFVAVAYVTARWARGDARADRPRAIPPTLVLWIILGAILTYAPLAAHFADNPDQFSLRTNQVSMFSPPAGARDADDRPWCDRPHAQSGLARLSPALPH